MSLKKYFTKKSRVIYLSIAAALLTLILKFLAYYLTGSIGLLGDAAESFVNLGTAILALLVLTYASRPADDTHAYGHEKAEYFSSGVEGTLIVLAAVGIGYSATKRLMHLIPLQNLDIGLVIALIASGINFAVANILLKAAKEHDSITLEADARHLLTDVWTSVGVVAGLVLAWFTGLNFIDPIIAYFVAFHIIFSGFDLLRRSFHGLMDYALPPHEVRIIEKILKKRSKKILNFHNIRTRKAGATRFIDFHILVAGDTTVQEAHDLCEEIEQEIEEKLSNTQVTIHVEPVEDKASWDVVKSISR